MAADEPSTRRCDALFLTHKTEILDAATRMVGNPSIAEELAQESWLRWLRHDYDPSAARPLLKRIVKNLALDWLRSSRSERDRLAAAQWQDVSAPDTERHALSREKLRLVEDALDALPARTRRVFLMRRLDGLSYAEIGARLGISGARACQLFKDAMLHLSDHFDR
ncbi:MAG: RNA polymerase sigma factor [Pseudomonadota bacterium]